jgi:arabinose operon protein AraL
MKVTDHTFTDIEAAIFDLDGTLYVGETALPGAGEVVKRLRQVGMKVLFITNKPLEPRQSYAAKLTRLGIPCDPDDVITSGFVLGYHLARRDPGLALYVVGEDQLKAELRGYGLQVLDEFGDQDPKMVIDPQGVDAVVVAFDRTLDYRKLNTAYQALLGGARFFATNPDMTCPMPGGAIPDAGATIAALEVLTGRKVELLAGKPSVLMMEVAMQFLDLPPQSCLLVGDRLETDIKMGQAARMQTALVLSGATRRQAAAHWTPPPGVILDDVGELLKFLKQ